MNYLITGRAGTGKTTIGREIRSRGFTVYDTGEMSIARWEHAITQEPVEVPNSRIVDKSLVHWNWVGAKLRALLEEGDVFITGSADNQLEFHSLFDRVFVLDVSPHEQAHRLRTRQTSDYGKDEAMIPVIIAEQAEFLQQALSLGAVAIDANRPLDTVVDNIIGQLN